MTREQFTGICNYCAKIWHTEKRGALWDYTEFQSRVLLATVETPERKLSRICLDTLVSLRRRAQRDVDIAALLAFEAQRHTIGDVLPSNFEVPMKTHGGARPNSGGARKGSGGARQGAGRPRKQAA